MRVTDLNDPGRVFQFATGGRVLVQVSAKSSGEGRREGYPDDADKSMETEGGKMGGVT